MSSHASGYFNGFLRIDLLTKVTIALPLPKVVGVCKST
ncbi:hypothetical protein CF149_02654 [Pseudomonas psychrophila]|nr:hypothetical protein CF149_02654 [Pseudomonas psychrophila]